MLVTLCNFLAVRLGLTSNLSRFADSVKSNLSHAFDLNIRDVRTITLEHWLRQLLRVDGRPLANSAKAKMRNLDECAF